MIGKKKLKSGTRCSQYVAIRVERGQGTDNPRNGPPRPSGQARPVCISRVRTPLPYFSDQRTVVHGHSDHERMPPYEHKIIPCQMLLQPALWGRASYHIRCSLIACETDFVVFQCQLQRVPSDTTFCKLTRQTTGPHPACRQFPRKT